MNGASRIQHLDRDKMASTGAAPGRATWAVAIGALSAGLLVLGLSLTPVVPAQAQALDDAVANILNNNCAAIAGPTGAQLGALCGGGPASSGVNTPAGGSPTAQSNSVSHDEENKIKKRLKERRDQQAGLPTGYSAGDSNDATFSLGGLAGFISGDYENVDKKTTGFTPGFNSDKFAGTVGLDYSFDKFVLGVAFNYSRTDGDFEANGGGFKTDSYGGYVYGSFTPIDNLYFDAVAGYAKKDLSSDRRVSFTNAGNAVTAQGTSLGSTDANEYKASLSGGYDFTYQNFTYGPRAGINYVRNSTDAFSESGNTGLELAFDKQTFTSITSSVGVHGSAAFSVGFGVLVPQVSADYIHEFGDGQKTLQAHFVQDLAASPTQISFQNDSPDRDYFGLGFGVVAVLPHGISPFVNYRALVGDSIKTTQTVSAGVRFEF